jgi:hypothetical protein
MLLIFIQEYSGANPGRAQAILNDIFCGILSPSRKISRLFLKLENNRFLPHTAAQLTDHLIF